MKDINPYLIQETDNILLAFEKLNKVPQHLTLFVVDEKQILKGTLTDGDIRRGFLKGLQLGDPVSSFMSTTYSYIHENELVPEKINLIKKKGVRLLPVLGDKLELIKIIDLVKKSTLLPIDAVIMAGGKGERLGSLTRNTPKPLLKIGSKSILEHNLERLSKYGINHVHITINHMGDKIMEHFGDQYNDDMTIRYVREEKPLGTAGALSMISAFTQKYILLMNADLFTNIDLEGLYNDLLSNNADMAIATSSYSINVPYAVLKTTGEEIKSIEEKPTYTYYANAGIYLFKRELVDFIPGNQYYDITDLIEYLLKEKRKIIKSPIIGYWIDIGKPEDFQKARELYQHLR